MEGVRELALANLENLPDVVKAKIRDDFRTVEPGNVSEYFKFHYSSRSDIVDKWLGTCKGYRNGSLDFDDFITLRFILEHPYVIKCDGCSSKIVGGAYFSCSKCFFQYPGRSYDLCCACYGSKKFRNHNHNSVDCFYDNQTLHGLSRRKFAETRYERDKYIEVVEKAMIGYASEFLECARTIKIDGFENDFCRVLNLDKNQKLGEICIRAKKLEEMPSEVVLRGASNSEKVETSTLPETKYRIAPRRIDLLGPTPSEPSMNRSHSL